MIRRLPSEETPNRDLYTETEELIQEIARIYTHSVDLTPDVRFYLLSILLKWPGSCAIGIEETARKNLVGLPSDLIESTGGIGSRFVEILLKAEPDCKLTYTAIGYWSPIGLEDYRRSVFHRPRPPSESERKLMVAYAYCFYALTFAGITEADGEPLYSVTQYNATKAPNCPGVTAEYLEDSDGKDANAWHIRVKVGEELLRFLGLTSWIENTAAQYDEPTLELALRGVLDPPHVEQRDKQEESEGMLRESARRALSQFRQQAARLPDNLKAEVNFTHYYLKKAFSGGKYAENTPINAARACFMLATHMMWRGGCPSAFTYTFTLPMPDPHGTDTTCTLTMGTSVPIQPFTRMMVSRIVWGLFINPLVLDYTAIERERQRAYAYRASSRLLGHNLPNFALAPCIAHLVRIERNVGKALESGEARRCPDDCLQLLRGARERAEMGISTFSHYETLLAYLLGADSLKDVFVPKKGDETWLTEERKKDEGLTPFPLAEVLEPLRRVVEMHKEQFACGWAERENIAQKFAVDMREAESVLTTQVLEQRSLLREALFNLVNNALAGLNKHDLESNRGVVRVAARITDDWLSIDVVDQGKGFGTEQAELSRNVKDVLATMDAEEFETVVSNLTTKSAFSTPQGALGLGLLFCAAYARSREWFAGRKGELIINPGEIAREGTGAAIRLVLPLKPLSDPLDTNFGE